MELQDKVLKCADCGADFIFTIGEQIFFQEKHFQNPPRRCRSCKSKRLPPFSAAAFKQRRTFARTVAKIETLTNCFQCGKSTTVPFKPTQGRPVLCRECYEQKRPMATA